MRNDLVADVFSADAWTARRFTARRAAAVLGCVLALMLCGTARAGTKSITVAPTTDPAGVRVDVQPGQRSGLTFVQVIDPKTGEVLRTLHAGPLASAESYLIVSDATLPPGAYKIRYREGVEMAFDATIQRPDSKVPHWLNPTDVTRVGDAIYVLDAGEFVPETRPEFANEMTVTVAQGQQKVTGKYVVVKDDVLMMADKAGASEVVSNFSLVLTPESIALVRKMAAEADDLAARRRIVGPRIFKMNRDGKLDATFGEGGAIVLPAEIFLSLRTVAVDPVSGNVVLPSMAHNLIVYDRNGKLTTQTIAGLDNPSATTNWFTVFPTSVAFGPTNHLYIPLGSYAIGRVYDDTKNGHEGILSTFTMPDGEGFGRYICSDNHGAFYTCGQSDQVTKHVDDGKAVNLAYTSTGTLKLARPTGGCAGGGLVWWVCHGPGYGPFWDSGGGGEVVLFWDTGKELALVERFGVPGVAENALEFLNPSAVSFNPQQTEVWITEDGGENKEGPKGNARVRRFLLKAKTVEEATIELK